MDVSRTKRNAVHRILAEAAMTRKKGTFSKVKAAKSNSRDRIGPVPPTKVVPHKDRAAKEVAKHPKKAIEKELEENET